jgi:hypothetical protein
MLSHAGWTNSAANEIRRYIITIGCRAYDHPSIREIPGAVDDAREVAQCFSELGFEHVLPDLVSNPTSDQVSRQLSEWCKAPQRSSHDRLVLYFSGHGELFDNRPDQQHRLLFRDAVPGGEHGSWRCQDIAFRISPPVSEILIVLDTCYAGAGSIDMVAAFNWLLKSSLEKGGIYRYAVISASRPNERAQDRVFSKAFISTLNNPSVRFGTTTANLPVREFTECLRDSMASDKAKQSPTFFDPGGCRVLPNRAYDPRRAAAAELGVAADLNYFVGRKGVLQTIESWLESGPSKVCVVAGSAGCGKSTLLARIASDKPRAFHLATTAHGKTLEDLSSALATVFNLPPEERQNVVASLQARKLTVRLLVDAIDESEQESRIIDELLIPLSRMRGARILLGRRREVAIGGRSQAVRPIPNALKIDLDDVHTDDIGSIAELAQSLLMAEHEPGFATPYRDAPDAAKALGNVLSRHAGNSYFLADLWSRISETGRNAYPHPARVGKPDSASMRTAPSICCCIGSASGRGSSPE